MTAPETIRGTTAWTPLDHVVVVEITSSGTAAAGALLADAGADVILIEPADLATSAGRRLFRQVVERADVLIEAEPPGRLAELGIDYTDLTRRLTNGEADTTPGPPPVNDQLIHASITPFGRTDQGIMSEARRRAAMTELTLQARGGHLAVEPDGSISSAELPAVVDPDRPPIPSRPATPTTMAAHVAVVAIMTALLARSEHGSQFVDVSVLAAANLSAGPDTVSWLSRGHEA